MTGADIVFFAIVAVYFVMKIYSVLGRKNDDSDYLKNSEGRVVVPEEFIKEKIAKSNEEIEQRISPASLLKLREDELEDFKYKSDSVKAGVLEVIRADKDFSILEFVGGAKAAFDMVLKAYSQKDKETLEMLLSDKLYKTLLAQIEANEASNFEATKSLISIDVLEISAASLDKNISKIKVKFSTEQIDFVKDEDGKIVDGDPSHIDSIEDEWTFERNIKSSNPNWKITSI